MCGVWAHLAATSGHLTDTHSSSSIERGLFREGFLQEVTRERQFTAWEASIRDRVGGSEERGRGGADLGEKGVRRG